jgi:hypothetical protein
MTIEQRQLATEGRALWFEYVRVNGYAFCPNRDGLKKLCRLLDLTIPWVEKRITAYLEA